MPQIREQIAMVHLPPSKTLKYLFHVRKTSKQDPLFERFYRKAGLVLYTIMMFTGSTPMLRKRYLFHSCTKNICHAVPVQHRRKNNK